MKCEKPINQMAERSVAGEIGSRQTDFLSSLICFSCRWHDDKFSDLQSAAEWRICCAMNANVSLQEGASHKHWRQCIKWIPTRSSIVAAPFLWIPPRRCLISIIRFWYRCWLLILRRRPSSLPCCRFGFILHCRSHSHSINDQHKNI